MVPNKRDDKEICLVFLIFIEKKSEFVNSVNSYKCYSILVYLYTCVGSTNYNYTHQPKKKKKWKSRYTPYTHVYAPLHH
jgi:hypothetical protein